MLPTPIRTHARIDEDNGIGKELFANRNKGR